MKTLALTLAFLLAPWVVLAADGADARFPKPDGKVPATYACMDVCDKTNPNASTTCGPVWPPVPDATYSEFRVIATTTPACAFDTIDIVEWNTMTAPVTEQMTVLGTLDDDGAVDCGLGANVACNTLRIEGPIFGMVWLTSNGATVGGATCTSFKVRLCQAFPH